MKRKSMVNPAKFGFRHTVVHFGMFDYELICVVGPIKNLVDYLREHFEDPHWDPSYNDPRALHITRQGYAPVVWLPRKPRLARDCGPLVHEIIHTLRAMLVDWAGIPFNNDTDEIFAYAAGHATTEIIIGLK